MQFYKLVIEDLGDGKQRWNADRAFRELEKGRKALDRAMGGFMVRNALGITNMAFKAAKIPEFHVVWQFDWVNPEKTVINFIVGVNLPVQNIRGSPMRNFAKEVLSLKQDVPGLRVFKLDGSELGV